MANEKRSIFADMWRASTIGIHLVISTFVGLFIGVMLDSFLNTKPWMMFIFLMLGIVAGFRDMFRMINKVEDKMTQMKTEDAPKPLKYDDDDDEDGDSAR